MAFVYRLSGLAGDTIGELPGAIGKSVNIAIGSLSTAQATVRLDHPDADTLLTTDTLLEVYETGVPGTTGPVLHFHGRQISAEETAAEAKASVACAWADPFWTLTRRLVGTAAGGYSRGTSLVPVDRGTIISELVATVGGAAATRVRMGTVAASSSTFVAGWYFKKVGDAIAELGATLDGPDWRVRPIPRDATDGAIGELDVLPSIGGLRPDAVFEYGDGLLNVASYRRGVDLGGTASRIYSTPPGYPDNATQAVLVQETPTSRELLEDVLSVDLNVDDLRTRLLLHHLAVRGGPRQTIEFVPVRDLAGGRVPRYGVDYTIGDIVPFRASVDVRDPLTATMRKRKRIDATVRVYAVALAIDEQGAATPTLTVTPSA